MSRSHPTAALPPLPVVAFLRPLLSPPPSSSAGRWPTPRRARRQRHAPKWRGWGCGRGRRGAGPAGTRLLLLLFFLAPSTTHPFPSTHSVLLRKNTYLHIHGRVASEDDFRYSPLQWATKKPPPTKGRLRLAPMKGNDRARLVCTEAPWARFAAGPAGRPFPGAMVDRRPRRAPPKCATPGRGLHWDPLIPNLIGPRPGPTYPIL